MQFICVCETDQAELKLKEVIDLFCRGLEQRQELPVMVARINIVANYFIEFATRRNRRAAGDMGGMGGTGHSISLQVGEINSHAVEIKVVDEGGFERIARKSHLLGQADLVSFDLINGGLMMRAILKWRTC